MFYTIHIHTLQNFQNLTQSASIMYIIIKKSNKSIFKMGKWRSIEKKYNYCIKTGMNNLKKIVIIICIRN